MFTLFDCSDFNPQYISSNFSLILIGGNTWCMAFVQEQCLQYIHKMSH